MSGQSSSDKAIGCFGIIVILVVVGAIYSGIRYFIDRPAYKTAHAAYVNGDCDAALPLYEKISNAYRMIDFGKTKANAKQEGKECKAYQEAATFGITGAFDFAVRQYPASPLAAFTKERSIAELNAINGELKNMAETCALREDLVNEGWLEGSEGLPRFDYYCGKFFAVEGDIASAMTLFTNILRDFPAHPMASNVYDTLSSEKAFCTDLAQVAAEPLIAERGNFFKQMLLDCGGYFMTGSDYGNAVTTYQEFLSRYPDSPEAEEVTRSLAKALIGEARASGSGTITEPDASGYVPGGMAQVVIQNDSPHRLKLVFSGPDARIEELEGCPLCKDYYLMGPMYCPEEGPIGTYQLTPGAYEILVEAIDDSGIIPFTGDWELIKSKEFYSCFFVVSR